MSEKTISKISSEDDLQAPPYDEVIEVLGVKLPFNPEIITPKIEKTMRNNRYEGGQVKWLQSVVKPGDTVLELGSGIGFCSVAAAQVKGVKQVVTVEANPQLIPVIKETHRLNGVETIDVRTALVTRDGGTDCSFYVRKDFWASSMTPGPRKYDREISLPALSVHELLKDVQPSIVLCDIEGGELDIFGDADTDLNTMRTLILKVHPKFYGSEGIQQIEKNLLAKGFQPDVNTSETSSIRVYQAAPKMNQPDTENLMPARSYKPWPIVNPRVFVATCMKDEGPFILEWIAWHRAIGVTNFVVYTNDCSDGTVELLDKLQDMGEVRHLPNPAVALGKTNFQPVALDYTHYLKEFREADYFVSIDVDEFINVRVGTGRLADLFKDVGPFDAISVSEINHGCNNRVEFERGWVTDQFPRHDTESPGRKRAQRGVKTITRLSPRVHKIRNHRPDFVPGLTDLAWFNGSGVRFQDLAQDPKANGVDSRGTYGIVSLEHYSIRSLHSYLMKMVRGDVVVADKSVSQRYWRQRNRNAHTSSVFNPTIVEAARTYYQTTFECVEELMDLHGACCMHHETRSKEILQQQEVSERLNWITENAWDTALEEELENSKRTSNKRNAP